MDMLYPGIPVQQGPANNYASPLKHGVTPSVNNVQNAMDLEKPSMVPDEDKVEYRRDEDADEKRKKGKKKRDEREQECETCKKRRSGNLNSSAVEAPETYTQTNLPDDDSCHVIDGKETGIDPGQHSSDSRDVISQNMVIRYSYCPECGKPFIPADAPASVIRTASASERLGAQYQTGYDIMPRGVSINTEV